MINIQMAIQNYKQALHLYERAIHEHDAFNDQESHIAVLESLTLKLNLETSILKYMKEHESNVRH